MPDGPRSSKRNYATVPDIFSITCIFSSGDVFFPEKLIQAGNDLNQLRMNQNNNISLLCKKKLMNEQGMFQAITEVFILLPAC